jgi:hypothetical protein
MQSSFFHTPRCIDEDTLAGVENIDPTPLKEMDFGYLPALQ